MMLSLVSALQFVSNFSARIVRQRPVTLFRRSPLSHRQSVCLQSSPSRPPISSGAGAAELRARALHRSQFPWERGSAGVVLWALIVFLESVFIRNVSVITQLLLNGVVDFPPALFLGRGVTLALQLGVFQLVCKRALVVDGESNM